MQEMNGKQIVMRAQNAKKKRELWKHVLQDCYELANPSRNPYGVNDQRPRGMERMFDSTALSSTYKAANRMLLELTPSEQIWFDLKAGPLLEIEVSKTEIEQLEKELSKSVKMLAMVFRGGSFVSAIHEAYLDLIIAGMGALLVLENDDEEPVLFESVPQHEVSIEDGAGGKVSEIYRDYKAKPHTIEQKWDDAEIPAELAKIISDSPDADVSLLEVTYQYKDPSGAKQWKYEVHWKEADKDPRRIVSRTYETNPWVVFRWSKVPGSPYGPGPVMLALPDVRTANKLMHMILQNAALAISGMYMVADDGVVNPDNVEITQGGIIPVARTGGTLGASIAPLDSGRNFDIGQVVLDDIRMSIKKIMFDNGLPDLDGSVRSATEIIQRMRELTQDIGGAIGRLTNELIVPLVQRTAAILVRRGLLPALKIDQYVLKVQVNSPLARVQQLQSVESVVQWLEIARAVGGEEAAALVGKIEDILTWLADELGVPADLVRTPSEREAEVKRLENLMIQAAAAQQAAGQGQGQVSASQLEIA